MRYLEFTKFCHMQLKHSLGTLEGPFNFSKDVAECVIANMVSTQSCRQEVM